MRPTLRAALRRRCAVRQSRTLRSLAVLLALCMPVHDETRCEGDAFDADVMKADVARLADPALDGRAPGTEGDRTTRAFLMSRFECLGITASEQKFGDTANIIAIVPGDDPDQIVVIGAHHDHL